MGCCQTHYETKVTHFEDFKDFYREDSLDTERSSAGTVRTEVTCQTTTTSRSVRGVEFTQTQVRKAKQYPNYDGGFGYRQKELRKASFKKDELQRASRLELQRTSKVTIEKPANYDGGFDLRHKDVIHELSSGEEEEEEPVQQVGVTISTRPLVNGAHQWTGIIISP